VNERVPDGDDGWIGDGRPSTIKPSTIRPSTILPSTIRPSTIRPSTGATWRSRHLVWRGAGRLWRVVKIHVLQAVAKPGQRVEVLTPGPQPPPR
jgi:hypothetical protein